MSATDLAAALSKAIGNNPTDEGEVKGWLDTTYPPLNEILSGDPDRGLPYGRIIEIYGPSSSGKTWLITELLMQAQKLGGVAGFSDHELAFNVEYARARGLKTEFPFWIYKQPTTWEESNTVACKAVEAIRKSGQLPPEAPIVWGFDSVAAMIPKSVFEKGIEEYSMNDTTALARVTSTTLRAINRFVADNNAIFIYLNQIRTKPGVVYGDPTTTPGGSAMEFFASVRLALGRKLVKDEDKELVGQIIGITTKKNRYARPLQECEALLHFPESGGSEFDRVTGLVQAAIAKGALSYSKPRITWTDGKQYFVKALVDKIKSENLYQELVDLYRRR